MLTIKLYLDRRAVEKDCSAPMKLLININSKTAMIGLGIKINPKQWNKKRCMVVNHPQSVFYNSLLQKKQMEAEMTLYQMIDEDESLLLHDVVYIKNRLADRLDPTKQKERSLFYTHFLTYMKQCNKPRTANLYNCTLKALKRFDSKFEERLYSDIDVHYLEKFERFLSKTAKAANARAIHFRNIRAVFNSAIREELTKCYPFNRFHIRTEETRKRALPISVLRKLMTEDMDNKKEQELLDTFRLSFLLVGINTIDLYNLKKIEDGRIEYDREKTGRHYSIKVEPEAQEIIKRNKGRKSLLHIADRYACAPHVGAHVGKLLKKITKLDISMYWARHSWATIASHLDIPKDTIAQALGHGKKTVTDIYIDYDVRKVDRANRKVIDYVLYGKGETCT